MSRKSSIAHVECPMVRISTEDLSERFGLLFMELWNILHIETVIYSQQQRDQLKSPVNIGPVYGAKLDDVLIIHVDASLFSNTHCLLTTGVMIAELHHHVNRIQTVVAGETLGDFFQSISE